MGESNNKVQVNKKLRLKSLNNLLFFFFLKKQLKMQYVLRKMQISIWPHKREIFHVFIMGVELLKDALIISLHLTRSLDVTWKLTNEMHI